MKCNAHICCLYFVTSNPGILQRCSTAAARSLYNISRELTTTTVAGTSPPPLAAGIAGESDGRLGWLTLSPLGYCSRRRGGRGESVIVLHLRPLQTIVQTHRLMLAKSLSLVQKKEFIIAKASLTAPYIFDPNRVLFKLFASP
jgi:hypothetical protein